MKWVRAGMHAVIGVALVTAALHIIRTSNWDAAAAWVLVAAWAGYSVMLERRADRAERRNRELWRDYNAHAGGSYAGGYRYGYLAGKRRAQATDQED